MLNARPLRFVSLLLCLGLAASLSSQVHADDFDRRGPYLGVNGVYAISLFQNEINELAGADDHFDLGDSPGVNARLGYRIFSWFAVEAQYEWVQSMDLKLLGIDLGDFKPNTVTGNLKFFLPTWRIQPYLLVGAGVALWDVESPVYSQSSTGFAGRVGLGLDTYLTKHWVFNVEGTGVLNTNDIDPSRIDSDITSISHLYYFSISAGITYRF